MKIRIGVVTGSRVDTNMDGSQQGRILQAIITDLKDVQNIQTCQAGDEFNPPGGCSVILGAGGDAYKIQLAVDDSIAPAMDPGGKRIYATDPDGAAEVAECRLHPDGKIELFNDEATITAQPDGTVSISNGAGGATLSSTGQWTFHGVSSTFDHPVTVQGLLTTQGGIAASGGAGAAVAVTGDMAVTGNVSGSEGTFGGKAFTPHKHGSVQIGSGQSGVPV